VGADKLAAMTSTLDSAAARARLLELIKELAVVHGKVTLSSGKEADYYIDLRRITLHHEASGLVGRVMLDLLDDAGIEFEAAGGLTLGADPVGTAIMHTAAARDRKIDAFVVRMTIVPAAMHLLGKTAWWLPRWLDKILPDVDVEGAKVVALHEARSADPQDDDKDEDLVAAKA